MGSWRNFVESFKNADMTGKHEEAIEMMDNGDIGGAKLLLLEELEQKPKSFNLLFTMGFLLYEQEEFHNALEFYDRCLAVKPNEFGAVLNKARILIDELDEFQDGLNTLELITIDSGDRDEAWQELKAGALLGLERFAECEEQCEKILKLDNKSLYALMIYADSCYEQENWQKAFELTEKILEIDSTDLDAKNDKADLLNLLGRPDESLSITENLISANSGDDQAWATKGESQMIKGEFDKAITSLENSTLIDPTFEGSWFSLSKAYSHENRVDDALDSLLVATSLEPDFLDELDESYFDNIRENPRFRKLKEKQSER